MFTPRPNSNVNRLASIDALRGIAALMVALYHVWGHYGVYPWPSAGVVPQTLNAGAFSYLVSPLRWGYLGVSLFLVLSGFCIHLPTARKHLETGSYNFQPKEFYLRRLWRLYPAYFAAVVFAWVLLALGFAFTHYQTFIPSIGDLISHLTLTHGYFDTYFFGIVIVFWSLALEFQLYLAYPIFLYLFQKIGMTWSLVLLVAIAIVWRYISLTVFHNGLISVSSTGPYTAMGSVLARMPEWLFGVWLAEYYVAGKLRERSKVPTGLLTFGLLSAALFSAVTPELWVLTDILFGLGFAALIATVLSSAKGQGAERITDDTGTRHALRAGFYGRVVWLGTISYSVYLFHLPLSWFVNPIAMKMPGVAAPFAVRLVGLALSIGVISLIYRVVEAPFLRAPRSGDAYYPFYRKLRQLIGMKTDKSTSMQFGGSIS